MGKLSLNRLAARLRHRRVAEGIMSGQTVAAAMVTAGYSKSTADKSSGKILKAVQEEMAEALERLLPRDRLVQTLIDKLDAKRTTLIYNPGKGEVERFESADHLAQIKAAELLAKLAGLIVRREEASVEHNHSVSVADLLAARRRAGLLPPVEADAVATAEPVTEDKTPDA